jgi:hypothetical protein
MKTIGDLLCELRKSSDKLSVYEELVTHLEKYITTDSYKPSHAIASKSGFQEIVNESTIEEVVCELKKVIRRLETEIDKISSTTIGSKDNGSKKRVVEKKSVAKKESKGRKTESEARKKIHQRRKSKKS